MMAADLASTPTAGLDVQLCGDAHLSNFGGFASPERQAAVRPERLRRDLPDRSSTTSSGWRPASPSRPATTDSRKADARGDAGVGEGVPGGDGRVRGDAHAGRLVRAHVRGGPQEGMRVGPGRAGGKGRAPGKGKAAQRSRCKVTARGARASGQEPDKTMRKAHSRDSLQALSKLRRAGRRRVPDRQPAAGGRARSVSSTIVRDVEDETARIVETVPGLPEPRSAPTGARCWRRFKIVDMARKVVGVGSVGTRAFIGAAAGPRRRRSAVPPGQGGDLVGARGPPAEEPLPPARRAGRAGAAADAGRSPTSSSAGRRACRTTGTTTGVSCAT